jgi:threonine/homoserine/homoserine lactone efflux protein
MTDLLTFALAVIALLATPGPTNTLLFTAGATQGLRSLRLIPAEIAGYLIAILSIGLWIAPLVADVPALGTVLRLLTACYLTAMAFRMWRHAPNLAAHDQLIQFRHVFVTTLLNPKALLFALGIVPLSDPDANDYLLAFSLLTAAVATCWIGLGVGVSRGLVPTRRKPLIPRLGATFVLGFVGYLVFMAL